MLIKLAFRNIFRNFRRTLLTFLAIAIGIMFLIIFDSMLTGIDKESYDRIINLETGHIKIFSKGYREDKENYPLDRSIGRPVPIMDRLRKDPEVAGVTPRLNFRIMLSDGIDQFPAVGVAIDTASDRSVFRMEGGLEKGEYLAGEKDDAMLIGKGLADDFGVSVGDYLTVLTRTRYDTYQALDLRIKGILQTEDPNIDWYSVVIPLDVGRGSLDMGSAVTEIDIKLKDPGKVDEFRDKLAAELPGVEVLTWQDLSEDLMAISGTKRRMSMFMLSTIAIVALIGISNTILLAAFERTKEIGMMAAMGMRRSQIVLLFVLEGAMIGMLGSITGCALGALLNWPFTVYGINWGFLLRDMGTFGYRVAGVSKGIWNINMFVTALVSGILISALVSIYPAWVAARMEPTAALRKR